MSKRVYAVIGANYGDECKGLATATISKTKKSTLNVLFNGGPQRGHTVCSDSKSHVFHNFGSGTFEKADTYYTCHFMANPKYFIHERKELISIMGDILPKVWVDKNTQITTPWDIYINQFLEESRGKERHGSCGHGIYETFHREELGLAVRYGEIRNMDLRERLNYFTDLRNTYFAARLNEIRKEKNCHFTANFLEIFFSDQVMYDFMEELKEFFLLTYYAPDCIYSFYDNIIFEGGQGLALDMDNKEEWPHLTPSHTGSDWIIEEINKHTELQNCTINVIYVTRTYITKHGAGPLKNSFSPLDYGLVDNTNIYNKWQGTIRYAFLNVTEMENRCNKDFSKWKTVSNKVRKEFFISHYNYVPRIPSIYKDSTCPYLGNILDSLECDGFRVSSSPIY